MTDTSEEITTTSEPTAAANLTPEQVAARRKAAEVYQAGQIRERILARTGPVRPADAPPEPDPPRAHIAAGLVAPALQTFGVPRVNPATPPSAETLAAMQAQSDRERAAMAAQATAQPPRTAEERIAALERTVARLVQLVPGAAGR